MKKIQFKCEKCGAENTFFNKVPGDRVICVKCGQGQRIPESTVAADLELSANNRSTAKPAPATERVHRSRVNQGPQEVVIKDIDMEMSAMVVFNVKWAIASIPAAFILGIILGIVALIFKGIIGAIF